MKNSVSKLCPLNKHIAIYKSTGCFIKLDVTRDVNMAETALSILLKLHSLNVIQYKNYSSKCERKIQRHVDFATYFCLEEIKQRIITALQLLPETCCCVFGRSWSTKLTRAVSQADRILNVLEISYVSIYIYIYPHIYDFIIQIWRSNCYIVQHYACLVSLTLTIQFLSYLHLK